MIRAPRPHVPTVVGRLRADRGLLLLVGTVVAATTALMGAVSPVAEQSADRAMAAAVRDAGSRGTVTVTLPEWYDDPSDRTRDPGTATQVRQDADFVRSAMPRELADVLRPGVTTVTTTPLHLLDAGAGRYLQLAFVDTADGPPDVSYAAGAAPGAARAGSVEVAVSVAAARALGLEVGDRIPARDEFGRSAVVVVSGTFVPDDADDEAWQVVPQLLEPTTSTSGDEPRTAATALVSDESLADLRLALPGDALRRRVVFAPEAAAVTWRGAASLERTIASLQSGAGAGLEETSWDSLLGTVLQDGRAQVAAARGQAQVLLVGLLTCAVLVLVLAGQLLVRRREGPLVLARERGAGLATTAGELVVESVVVTCAGAAVGLGVGRLGAGSVGWAWSLPVLVVSVVAPAVLAVGVVRHLSARTPANRSVRRARARSSDLRRWALELAVLAATGLSWVALRQRGVVGDGVDGAGGGDLTAASATSWAAATGALVLVRLAPPVLRWALRRTRRSASGVPLFVTARLVRTAAGLLPVTVVLVAVSGATFAAALAGTLRDGQSTGARSVVGADARLDARPDPSLADVVAAVADAPGVRAAAAARVEDGVRVSAREGSAFVRLVVVDAPAYAALLAAGDLPDAPQLARLRATSADRVPALFLGGPAGLREEPILRWEDTSIPLADVGTAPDVEASLDPVVVVDAAALARAGVVAPPDTVWAVGTGAAGALDVAADRTPGSTVVTYAEELERRRDAALPSSMARLAAASCVLLPALALLGVALAAAAGSPARRTSLGRLRALGASARDLRRVLVGELAIPVGVAGLAGLGVGVGCAHVALGSLSLERLTLAPGVPAPVLPWWTVLSVALLVAWAAGLALLEWRQVRRTPLAELLRT